MVAAAQALPGNEEVEEKDVESDQSNEPWLSVENVFELAVSAVRTKTSHSSKGSGNREVAASGHLARVEQLASDLF